MQRVDSDRAAKSVAFHAAWISLAADGRVDDAGGAEYRRVRRQFLAATPADPIGFIVMAANRPPTNNGE